MKKLPWVSLLLLLLTCGVFGWLIATPYPDWRLWAIAAVVIVLIALASINPLNLIEAFYTSWLRTDTKAFVSVIIGAFIAVVVLRWLEISVRVVVLLSAFALARLDLQAASYRKWEAFGLLATVSLIGFGLGLLSHQLQLRWH